MFLGHLAVGFASKVVARRASLGWLLLAPLFLDLIWPLFLYAGWERVRIEPGNTVWTPLAFEWYPWSHSLVMALVWSVVVAAIVLVLTRDSVAALMVFGGVQSHWLLDWLVHRPDLPVWPHDGRYGFGLWNSVPATLALELSLYAAGVWLYTRSTRARGAGGRWGWWTFAAFLLVLFAASALGPPPPSVEALRTVGLLMWLFPVLAWWIDRHREPV